MQNWRTLREAAVYLLADVREGGGWSSYYTDNYGVPRRLHVSRLLVLPPHQNPRPALIIVFQLPSRSFLSFQLLREAVPDVEKPL